MGNVSMIPVSLDELLRGLPQEIVGEFKEWIESSKSVTIIVTGKTGAGKSTLVNALIGEEIAKEGDTLNPETALTERHKKKIFGYNVAVCDTPGLRDVYGTERESAYISDMKKKCPADEVDLFMCCISVSQNRFTEDSTEIEAMKELTAAYGRQFWDHAIIALTFANEIEERDEDIHQAKMKGDSEKASQLFKKKIAEWESEIREALITNVGVDKAQVEKLVVIPTGHQESGPDLPDRKHWLSTFWFSAVSATHPRAQPAMVLMNHNRIIATPEETSAHDRDAFLHKQHLIYAERGVEIGKSHGSEDLGGRIGAAFSDKLNINTRVMLFLHSFCKYRVEAVLSNITEDENPEGIDNETKSSLKCTDCNGDKGV